jgi:hypothetical protein
MVKFPDKCEWQNGFNPDNKRGLVWYLDRYKTNKSTGAKVYIWGLRRGDIASAFGLHTLPFQDEIIP